MSYNTEHKQRTRAKIIESARILFNRHGFQGVTIDMVMAGAELTRGGFYNHFNSKQELHGAAVSSFLSGRGAIWRADAGVDRADPPARMARQMIQGYLSSEHLDDLDGQCPMIALPSDAARSDVEVRSAYQKLLVAMVSLFEDGVGENEAEPRQKALSLAALCVGGMVLARTLPDSTLAEEIREAAYLTASEMVVTQ
jgi:TetR/AcrR family transcriptional regulator, transcriptional repressor for nem operon